MNLAIANYFNAKANVIKWKFISEKNDIDDDSDQE